jgi:hypothetical protein
VLADPAHPTDGYADCLLNLYSERLVILEKLIGPVPSRRVETTIDISKKMRSGEILALGDTQVRCRRGALQVLFGGPTDGLNSLGGGLGEWVECPVDVGHMVRLKLIPEDPGDPNGMCGADPPETFSVWLNGHRVVRPKEVGSECLGWTFQSATVGLRGYDLCQAVRSSDGYVPPRKARCSWVRY